MTWTAERSACELLCEVGSGAHGTALEGTDDHDEMGIVIEPAEYVIGLRSWETTVKRDRPEGVRSQAGDTDLVIHSLRKWVHLALNGNPTIIALLWAPMLERPTVLGHRLRYDGPTYLLSRRALPAYCGYLLQQKERLLGIRGQKRTKRPELVEAHGYDTKYAAHALRLGWQGVELATTGAVAFPMEDEQRAFIRSLRRGEVPFEDAIHHIEKAERDLIELRDGGAGVLPDQPDREWANRFLVEAYQASWRYVGR